MTTNLFTRPRGVRDDRACIFATSCGAALVIAALQSAAVDATGGPEVLIPRINVAPRVSDFVDAVARSQGIATLMARVEGFTTQLPRDGERLSERTEVYLGYDDEAIHAVFVCSASDANLVRAHLAGRDRIPGDDDTVAFQLDTFRDLVHAYGFQVNPLGIQQDGIWTEGKGWDLSFDTIWRSEGRLTDDGYVVVLSVPFTSLRFPPGPIKTFGMMLFRGIARTNEQGFWPRYTTSIAGRMNQAATLTGLSQVSPGRNWQITPYANARAYRTLAGGSDRPSAYLSESFDAAVGVDLKFVPRDSLSVDVAVNPDFSQVESDEPQVTVNQRFEVFFPEKRPFFLENAAFFDTPIPLFFSRRIQDPIVGGRVTARQGRTSIGAIVARDEARTSSTAAILRLSRDLGQQSTIGVFGSTQFASNARHSVAGVDARIRLSTTWSATVQSVGSFTAAVASDRTIGHATRASLRRNGRSFNYSADLNERSAGFASSVGFIDRVDVRTLDQTASYRRFVKNGSLLSWGPDLSASIVHDRLGRPLEHVIRPSVTFDWPRLTQLTVYRRDGTVRLRSSEFRLFDPARRISAPFSQDQWGVSVGSSPTGALTFSANASVGQAINLAPAPEHAEAQAQEISWNANVEFRPSTRLAMTFSGLRTALREPESATPIFTNAIVRTRVQFQFTRALAARAIVQYDTLTTAPGRTRLEARRKLNVDLLLTYLVSPGRALYVGYNDDLATLDRSVRPFGVVIAPRPPNELLSTGRQLFVKASYLIRR